MSAPPTKPSTSMPTVKLSLGRHVVTRPRKDGTTRALFVVQDWRPSGWQPSIPLAADYPGPQRLGDAGYVAAIQKQAAQLRERLQAARLGHTTDAAPRGSLPALWREWETSPEWQALKPRTRQFYAVGMRHCLAFWLAARFRHVADITPASIREWLDKSGMAPGYAKQCRTTLSAILSRAVEAGLIEANPVGKLAKRKAVARPKKIQPTIATQATVDAYVEAALSIGWPGGAILVSALWDTMARLFDATRWRRDMVDMDTGAIWYTTSKSDDQKEVCAILSPKTLDLIRRHAGLYLVTRPDGTVYREHLDDAALTRDWKRLRKAAMAAGAPYLIARHLRHSVMTDARDAGLTSEQLRVNNSHSDDKLARRRYMQETHERAMQVAVARGILGRK